MYQRCNGQDVDVWFEVYRSVSGGPQGGGDTEEDMEEIMRDFIKPFNIPLKNVVVMPGLDDA